VTQTSFEKIPCRNNRVHEGIGKGLLTSASREMKDDCGILRSRDAILTRQKIAFDQNNFGPVPLVVAESLQPLHLTGRSHQAMQIAESEI
jgi:hypothetical protein